MEEAQKALADLRHLDEAIYEAHPEPEQTADLAGFSMQGSGDEVSSVLSFESQQYVARRSARQYR